jgi:hypothetical protein
VSAFFSSSNDYVHIVTPVLVNKTVLKKSSVADLGIWAFYPGSLIFTHPGSWIKKQQQKLEG